MDEEICDALGAAMSQNDKEIVHRDRTFKYGGEAHGEDTDIGDGLSNGFEVTILPSGNASDDEPSEYDSGQRVDKTDHCFQVSLTAQKYNSSEHRSRSRENMNAGIDDNLQIYENNVRAIRAAMPMRRYESFSSDDDSTFGIEPIDVEMSGGERFAITAAGFNIRVDNDNKIPENPRTPYSFRTRRATSRSDDIRSNSSKENSPSSLGPFRHESPRRRFSSQDTSRPRNSRLDRTMRPRTRPNARVILSSDSGRGRDHPIQDRSAGNQNSYILNNEADLFPTAEEDPGHGVESAPTSQDEASQNPTQLLLKEIREQQAQVWSPGMASIQEASLRLEEALNLPVEDQEGLIKEDTDTKKTGKRFRAREEYEKANAELIVAAEYPRDTSSSRRYLFIEGRDGRWQRKKWATSHDPAQLNIMSSQGRFYTEETDDSDGTHLRGLGHQMTAPIPRLAVPPLSRPQNLGVTAHGSFNSGSNFMVPSSRRGITMESGVVGFSVGFGRYNTRNYQQEPNISLFNRYEEEKDEKEDNVSSWRLSYQYPAYPECVRPIPLSDEHDMPSRHGIHRNPYGNKLNRQASGTHSNHHTYFNNLSTSADALGGYYAYPQNGLPRFHRPNPRATWVDSRLNLAPRPAPHAQLPDLDWLSNSGGFESTCAPRTAPRHGVYVQSNPVQTGRNSQGFPPAEDLHWAPKPEAPLRQFLQQNMQIAQGGIQAHGDSCMHAGPVDNSEPYLVKVEHSPQGTAFTETNRSNAESVYSSQSHPRQNEYHSRGFGSQGNIQYGYPRASRIRLRSVLNERQAEQFGDRDESQVETPRASRIRLRPVQNNRNLVDFASQNES